MFKKYSSGTKQFYCLQSCHRMAKYTMCRLQKSSNATNRFLSCKLVRPVYSLDRPWIKHSLQIFFLSSFIWVIQVTNSLFFSCTFIFYMKKENKNWIKFLKAVDNINVPKFQNYLLRNWKQILTLLLHTENVTNSEFFKKSVWNGYIYSFVIL